MVTGTHVDTESSCPIVKPTLPYVPSLVYAGTTVSLFYHGLASKNTLIAFVRNNCFGRLEIKCVSNQTYRPFSYGEENFGKIWSLSGEH